MSATSLTIPHCVQVVLVLGSAGLVLLSPFQVSLQSQLLASPIEGRETCAWGLHPDNGLEHKARDSLSVEVCLANPDLINVNKCSLPLSPLSVCVSNPGLTTRDSCAGLDNKYPSDVCANFPSCTANPPAGTSSMQNASIFK